MCPSLLLLYNIKNTSMKSLLSLALLAFVVNTSSCSITLNTNEKKPQKTVDRTFNLRDFQNIKMESVANVRFTQGNTYKVTATAFRPGIDTIYVKENTLYITTRRNLKNNNSHCTIEVTAPSLKSLEQEGVGNFTCQALNTKDLDISLEGVGSASFGNVSCTSLEVDCEGVGSLSNSHFTVSGNASFDFSGVGSGTFSVKSNNCKLESSGVGSVTATVNCKSVVANCSGIGSIILKGNTNKLNKTNSSLGKINTKGLEVK